MPPPATETSDVEQGTPQETPPPPPRPSSVPSFLFISFVLWMIMNNQGDEVPTKTSWQDTLAAVHANIQSYSAWLNGTASNFSMVCGGLNCSFRG
jgi:transmembrane E3 ubiquitin-protein ligase